MWDLGLGTDEGVLHLLVPGVDRVFGEQLPEGVHEVGFCERERDLLDEAIEGADPRDV